MSAPTPRKFPAKPPAPARPFQVGDRILVSSIDGALRPGTVDAFVQNGSGDREWTTMWIKLDTPEYASDGTELALSMAWVSDDRTTVTGPQASNTRVELLAPADEGRIHDPAEAERLAYAEDAERAAWTGYESIRDDIRRQNAARLASGPSIIRRVLDAVDAQSAEPDGNPADIGEDDGVHREVTTHPTSSQAGLASVTPALVQLDRDDAAERALAALLEWEAVYHGLVQPGEHIIGLVDRLADAARDYRQTGGGSR